MKVRILENSRNIIGRANDEVNLICFIIILLFFNFRHKKKLEITLSLHITESKLGKVDFYINLIISMN